MQHTSEISDYTGKADQPQGLDSFVILSSQNQVTGLYVQSLCCGHCDGRDLI